MKKSIIFLISLTVLAMIGCVIFTSCKIYAIRKADRTSRIALENKKHGWLKLKNKVRDEIRTFDGTAGVVIKDLNTDWEIAFNKSVSMPSASLVKIPVMLSCFYAEKDGKIKLEDVITLKASEKVEGSKILADAPSGSRFTVDELLDPMITQSDNTAANLIIDYIGFDDLNLYFRKMGLKNTNLVRKMMDFKERKDGKENYTTTADMAYLMEKLYHRQFLDRDVSEKCLNILRAQKVNDRIPRKLPQDETVIAHKTGLERYICHDVGIVYTKKGTFLICVLVEHKEKTARNAKELISEIALDAYNYYRNL